MDQYYGQQYLQQDFKPPNSSNVDNNEMNEFHFDMSGSNMYGNQMANRDTMQGVGRSGQGRSTTSATVPDGDSSQPDMMAFNGNSSSGNMRNYRFSTSDANGQGFTMPVEGVFPKNFVAGASDQRTHLPLSIDTRYTNPQPPFSNMASPVSAYPSPMHPNTPMNMGMMGQFVPQNFPITFDWSDPRVINMMNSGMIPYSMTQQAQYPLSMPIDPTPQNYSRPMQTSPQDPGGGQPYNGQGSSAPDTKPDFHILNAQDPNLMQSNQARPRQHSVSRQSPMNQTHPSTTNHSPIPQQVYQIEPGSGRQSSWEKPPKGHLTSWAGKLGLQTNYINAYSSTGFDMLNVLMRIATRENPQINIGSVDLSCAFVVCDASEHDFPIVYCSENFERLTGYTKHEILGRNCRFLQSPDGKVQAGVKRRYVDDGSVLYLKNLISARKEAQVSLINYRKGGQPFMNLLTMIPIPYDNKDEIEFFVGFQVDLVEQPQSVTNKNPDGSYTINYQRGLNMPRYVFSSDKQTPPIESGQTVSRDDVSTVLSTIGTGESELSKRLWDKVLLENTDDVIIVLSLKGLFLYLSPACKSVLEYEAGELMNTALSSVCHPSDIVPVTRELKDTSSSTPVNVVFRIRRKTTGYMWFEGHGALHTEQGKGRKTVMLVGRERPVYSLSKSDILSSGGIGDSEVWTKLSTSGIFLYVSGSIRSLLDRQPDELVGTSIQALMRPESKADFGRILEIARTGKKASVKHDLLNKRGQVMQAFSTIYPGDAVEGSKPTFIIAQTRLLKYTRPGVHSTQRPQPSTKTDCHANLTVAKPPSSHGPLIPGQGYQSSQQNSSPQSLSSPHQHLSTFESATTYAGQDNLVIGHQDVALASDENLFDELKTTRSTSWQFELRQMEKRNRLLAEELQGLLAAKKKRKRRKGTGQVGKECANCHTSTTPEWRRGQSGNKDLCNSCGLKWAKQQGRISPRTSSQRSAHSGASEKKSVSPAAKQPQVYGNPSVGSGGAPNEQSNLAETGQKLNSPQQQQNINDDHIAKSAKLETRNPYSYEYRFATKIEEGDEHE